MGILNANATTMIAATAGYDVVSLDATGEIERWPIIGWGIVPHYGYGDPGCILPITVGMLFNADAHAVSLPMAARSPIGRRRGPLVKDAKTWASAVDEAMAAQLLTRHRPWAVSNEGPPYATDDRGWGYGIDPLCPQMRIFIFSLRGKFACCAGNFAPKFCTTRCAVGAGATASKV